MTIKTTHAEQAIRDKRIRSFKRAIFLLSFIFIPTVYFLIFYVYVNGNSFVMAFQLTRRGVGTYWTLENFTRFFGELSTNGSEMGEAFRNTFITFGVNMLMFFVGFFVSFFLYKKIFMYRFFKICFFLPSLIAGTIINSVFMQVIGVNGPVAEIVKNLYHLDYMPDLLDEPRFANKVILGNLMWLNFPMNMVLLSGSFGRIPESVLESAKLDGANWLQEAFKIVIPMVWPTVGLLLMMNIAGVFGSSGNVFLLTQGDAGTQTLSNWMYMQLYNVSGNPEESNAFNYMSAVGLLLTVISVTIALTVRKLSDKMFGEVQY